MEKEAVKNKEGILIDLPWRPDAKEEGKCDKKGGCGKPSCKKCGKGQEGQKGSKGKPTPGKGKGGQGKGGQGKKGQGKGGQGKKGQGNEPITAASAPRISHRKRKRTDKETKEAVLNIIKQSPGAKVKAPSQRKPPMAHVVGTGTGTSNYSSFDISNPAERERRLAKAVTTLLSLVCEQKIGLPKPGRESWDMKKLVTRRMAKKSVTACKMTRDKERLIMLVDTSPSCTAQAKLYSNLATHAALTGIVDIYACPNGYIEREWVPQERAFMLTPRTEEMFRYIREKAEWPFKDRTIIFFTDYDGYHITHNSARNGNEIWYFTNDPIANIGRIHSDPADRWRDVTSLSGQDYYRMAFTSREGMIWYKNEQYPTMGMDTFERHYRPYLPIVTPTAIDTNKFLFCPDDISFIENITRMTKTL